MSLNDHILNVNTLKAELDSLRPLSSEAEGRVMQKFRLEWNYNSNAIEGNSLDFGETVALLNHGLTAKGKPIKDHMDIKGHNEAIDFMMGMIKDERQLTEQDIKELHSIILVEPYKIKAITPNGDPTTKWIKLGEYKDTPNHVETLTGEMHYYATPEETPSKMTDLVDWYNERLQSGKTHALQLAALFHHRFVAIHPFDDGNGRLGRILMNLCLMKMGYPPIVVPMERRTEYYSVLNQADNDIDEPLLAFLAELLGRSLDIYVKGANGEVIAERQDLDKEINLFKMGLASDETHEVKTHDSIISLVSKSVIPYFKLLKDKFEKFDELFLEKSKWGLNIEGDDESVDIGSDFSKIEQIWIDNNIKDLERLPSIYRSLSDNKLIALTKNSTNLKIIRFEYTFLGYKKIQDPFDLSLSVLIEFEKYKYNFIPVPDRNKMVSKKYHENLTNQELDELVSTSIKGLMNTLDQKTKAK